MYKWSSGAILGLCCDIFVTIFTFVLNIQIILQHGETPPNKKIATIGTIPPGHVMFM